MSGKGFLCTTIAAASVDELVIEGIRHIKHSGESLRARSGSGLQAYCVEYVLTDSRARLHLLRYPKSVRYLCRELLAFFSGSLNVHDGLSQASKTWVPLATGEGRINSNYGYYVFRQQVNGRSQYDWVIETLQRNIQSRRALININQLIHKEIDNRDFPCAIALQFYVQGNKLCCDALVRSADVITGLPYDVGFFSFLTELLTRDLSMRAGVPLSIGHTRLRSSFTQLYDHNSKKAEMVLQGLTRPVDDLKMPPIEDPTMVLEDILGGTATSVVLKWISEHAELDVDLDHKKDA